MKQQRVISISELSRTLRLRILARLIKTREKDETKDLTVLLLWCGPRDLWCQRLRGLSLRHLSDVKVKESSLYSTGSPASA